MIIAQLRIRGQEIQGLPSVQGRLTPQKLRNKHLLGSNPRAPDSTQAR